MPGWHRVGHQLCSVDTRIHKLWEVDVGKLQLHFRSSQQGRHSGPIDVPSGHGPHVAVLDLAPAQGLHEGVQHVLMEGEVP